MHTFASSAPQSWGLSPHWDILESSHSCFGPHPSTPTGKGRNQKFWTFLSPYSFSSTALPNSLSTYYAQNTVQGLVVNERIYTQRFILSTDISDTCKWKGLVSLICKGLNTKKKKKWEKGQQLSRKMGEGFGQVLSETYKYQLMKRWSNSSLN